MKNNILYIIGVAFALVLMVFFSGFFRNVDFFPEENIAENYKEVLIIGLNDPLTLNGLKKEFSNLYKKNNLTPSDEMLLRDSECFKKQMFKNVINVEDEEKQIFLSTKTEIYSEDDYKISLNNVLKQFKNELIDITQFCYKANNSENEIKEDIREEITSILTFLECDTEEWYSLWLNNGNTIPIESGTQNKVYIEFSETLDNINWITVKNIFGKADEELTYYREEHCDIWDMNAMNCKWKDSSDGWGELKLNRINGDISYVASFKTGPENLDGSSNTALAEIYGTCKKVRNFKTKF